MSPNDFGQLATGLRVLLGCEVTDFHPLATESRNAIARLTLEGRETSLHAILKTYEPAGDPHWANRFRREEKVLTLLAGAQPPVAPHPIAGWIPANGPAALLMDDAGQESLADALTRDGSANLWPQAAEFLAGLHAAMRPVSLPLKRTAMAISLDRINGPVLLQRLRVASTRVLGEMPETGVQRDVRALVAPLLVGEKAMVHNSMSPLNVVIGNDGWLAIDWETLTFASPLWDWAELLRAPYNPPPFDESERLMLEATGYNPDTGRDLFRRAVFSRHIDSLATVVQRRRRYEAESKTDRAAQYARRAAFYARDLEDLAARLDVSPRLAAWLGSMRESALS